MKSRQHQDLLLCYRLCVKASGSLITNTVCCFTLINDSFLHLGQYRGKCISSLSDRICRRVLLPHAGHKIQSRFFVLFTPFSGPDVCPAFSDGAIHIAVLFPLPAVHGLWFYAPICFVHVAISMPAVPLSQSRAPEAYCGSPAASV